MIELFQTLYPIEKIILTIGDFALIKTDETFSLVHICSRGSYPPNLYMDISGCFYCKKKADFRLLFVIKAADINTRYPVVNTIR